MILRQSVILPVRNGATFVRQAIVSTLSQLAEDDEIVVVDNGSTDDTISTVNALADPRVRLVEEVRLRELQRELDVGAEWRYGSRGDTRGDIVPGDASV